MKIKEQIKEVFKELKIRDESYFHIEFWLKDDLIFTITTGSYACFDYGLYDNKIIYHSPAYNTYEQLYDELIIFKELILPKYLDQ